MRVTVTVLVVIVRKVGGVTVIWLTVTVILVTVQYEVSVIVTPNGTIPSPASTASLGKPPTSPPDVLIIIAENIPRRTRTKTANAPGFLIVCIPHPFTSFRHKNLVSSWR